MTIGLGLCRSRGIVSAHEGRDLSQVIFLQCGFISLFPRKKLGFRLWLRGVGLRFLLIEV